MPDTTPPPPPQSMTTPPPPSPPLTVVGISTLLTRFVTNYNILHPKTKITYTPSVSNPDNHKLTRQRLAVGKSPAETVEVTVAVVPPEVIALILMRDGKLQKRSESESNFDVSALSVDEFLTLISDAFDPPTAPKFGSLDAADVNKVGGYCEDAPNARGDRATLNCPQLLKRTVTVVRGESGSGKTAFASNGLKTFFKCEHLVYWNLAATVPDLKDPSIPNLAKKLTAIEDEETNGINAAPELEAFLHDVLCDIRSVGFHNCNAQSEAREYINAVLRGMLQNRNDLAVSLVVEIFEAAIREQLDPNTEATKANLKASIQRPGDRLRRVLFVIDEIGCCLAFARAVASAQLAIYRLLAKYCTHVELVLVGTGADFFTRSGKHRASTDPGLVSLTTIEAPAKGNETTLLFWIVKSPEKQKYLKLLAAEDKSPMRYLLNNARLTVLFGTALAQGDTTFITRLIPGFIVNAVQLFSSMNGLKQKGPTERQKLLNVAYWYHMERANRERAGADTPATGSKSPPSTTPFGDPVLDAQHKNDMAAATGSMTRLLSSMPFDENTNRPMTAADCALVLEDCANYGIHLRGETDGNPTYLYRASNAMKLIIMSAIGQLVQVGDGYGYEDLTGAMLVRQLQLEGFEVTFLKLSLPLPLQNTGCITGGLTDVEVKSIVTGLLNGADRSRKRAIVMQNGEAAEGADLIVLQRAPLSPGPSRLRCTFVSCKNRISGKGWAGKFEKLGLPCKAEVSATAFGLAATFKPPASRADAVVFALQRLLQIIAAAAPTATENDIVQQLETDLKIQSLVLNGQPVKEVELSFVVVESQLDRTPFTTSAGTIGATAVTPSVHWSIEAKPTLGLWGELIETTPMVPKCLCHKNP